MDELATLVSVWRDEFSDQTTKTTYRIIADRYDVSPAMVWKMLNNDYDPKDSTIRSRLGLPVAVEVTTLGIVEPGSLTMASRRCIHCARPYIPNHGKRRTCFICVPYRRRQQK